MREQIPPHIGLYLRSHDVTNRRHIVVGDGVDDPQNDVPDPHRQNQRPGQCQRPLTACRVRKLPNDHRKDQFAYGRQRGAKHVERHDVAIGLVVGKKPLDQPDAALFLIHLRVLLCAVFQFLVDLQKTLLDRGLARVQLCREHVVRRCGTEQIGLDLRKLRL